MIRALVCALLVLLSVGSVMAQVTARVQFSITGYGPGQAFREPLAVAVEPGGGMIYVADAGNNRLRGFNAQGIPNFQSDFDGPLGVAAARDRVYVTSGGKVRVVGRRGEPQSTLDLSRAGPEGTLKPARLAVDEEGTVYVADVQGSQVLKFDARGNFLNRFGRIGDGLGEFRVIAGVAVDQLGRTYVTDSLGVPVQVFDRAGRFLTSLGRRGPGPEEFAFPAGIAADRFGRIWVVDHYRHHVKGFDVTGRFLGTVGSYGQREGEFFFPIDVAVDEFGRLLILEKGANRLQVFRVERL